MSQAKVDKNKALKANRSKIVKKKKMEYIISMTFVTIIAVAIIGWIGYSIYTKAVAYAATNATVEYTDVDTSALMEYLGGLQ